MITIVVARMADGMYNHPCHSQLNFLAYEDESSPLKWLNK